MRVTPADVEGWIAEGEGRRIEFKRGLPASERVARSLCAFANTNGGILLIGVTDQGRLWGVPRPEQVMDKLRAVARDVLEPPLDLVLRAVRLEDKTVVCCSVPLSPARPHAVLHADGSPAEVCVRVGSSNRGATGPTLRAVRARPARAGLDELERRVLDWVVRHTPRGDQADGGSTVGSFAKAHNVGVQRARRAFVNLERAGRIVGHGTGARRVYGAA